MKIKSISSKKEIKGIEMFSMGELGDVVVLAGENGSGKTRFFKLIEDSIMSLKNGENFSDISIDIEGKIKSVINFSHSELSLQLPDVYPPYVINISEDNLKKDCNFTRTSYEALLYITKLARYGEKDKLEKFNQKFCKPLLGCEVKYNPVSKKVIIFENISIDELQTKPLSPGQTYLLRLCVALSCHDSLEGSIIILDEPETHLHPKALLTLFDILRTSFSLGQIWVATHSVELISYFYYESIWYIQSGKIRKMGSQSQVVIRSLIGDENKRTLLYQFVTSPDAYALSAFATECLLPPDVKSGVNEDDPSTSLANAQISVNDIVLDYGAGKGRFCERLILGANRKNISVNFYAYDKYGYISDQYGKCSADECKAIMKKYNISEDHYVGDCSNIKNFYDLNANKVVLINVLHEIAPSKWLETFDEIGKMICNDGYVLIVERTELTYGEKPYDSDYFVLQPECIETLFACSKTDFEVKVHETSKRVVAYCIPASILQNATNDTIKKTILKLKDVSADHIRSIKQNQSQDNLWLNGIKLAFWSHQFVNACLFDMNELDKIEMKGDSNAAVQE